ncbi:MAG: DMT family transporter [Gammaproteobacteria bacterium]|nr:DMT family transporter [Gammaproteobacteria bacterium]MDH3413844.1 DMT family transporter [Gammaproteobacteria bacterium]
MNRLAMSSILVALGFAWGLTIPFTKIAVSSGHKPPGLIFWQLVFSAIVLAGVSLYRQLSPRLDRRALAYYLAIGLIGTILPNNFSYLAAAQLPGGVLAIIIASVPMFTLVIANSLRIERFSLIRASGVLLGAVAVMILILPKTSLPDSGKAIFVLVALAAAFCYGAEANFIATRRPQGIDPVMTLLGASVLGIFIAGPMALFTGTWVDLFAPWNAPEWALLFSSLCHVITYTGYIWLVGVAGPVFSSQVAYVVTLSGVFLSALILSERYSSWVWVALVLMIAGLALVQPREARRAVLVGEV